MPEVVSYEFDEFRFDVKKRRLLRRDKIVSLPPKAVDALEFFLKNQGKIIDKRDLMKTLWSDVVVSESNLTQTVYLLRKATGGKDGHFIENISKRGYRFIGEVKETRNNHDENLNGKSSLTDDADAYEEYLKANRFRSLHTAEGFEKAFFHARRAVEIDPDFALAHVEIAACYELLRLYGAMPAAQAVPQIKTALDIALRLDENAAEAFVILGSIKTFYDWEFEEAERALERAIELKPDNMEALTVYNELLIALERFEEAEKILRRALETEPLTLILPVSLARLYYYWRKYDEALNYLHPVIEKDPNFSPALLTLGNIYEAQGESFRTTTVLLKIAERNDVARQWALVGLGRIYGITGLKTEAFKVLDELLQLSKTTHVSAYTVAALYEALDERDKVFEWLQKAYDARTNQLIHLKVDPHFDKVREDVRFNEFLVRLRLL
jgi:DNA-binding winged helix-turn-helix (wHTH) protein